MRGKGINGQLLLVDLRITPAYAGKSQLLHYRNTDTKDHPRLCGEK